MTAKVYLEKDERYVNKRILESANGMHCTVNGPLCIGGTGTTVWAHSPYPEHGKAGGRKAHDCFGCYACYVCHLWLDGPVDLATKRFTFFKAMAASWLILLRTGVLR